MAVEIGPSNIAIARGTVQRDAEPLDIPNPTTGHSTALQRDKIQLHHPEGRQKLLQPGKHHSIFYTRKQCISKL